MADRHGETFSLSQVDWDRLTPQQRNQVRSAKTLSMARMIASAAAQNNRAVDAARAQGVTNGYYEATVSNGNVSDVVARNITPDETVSRSNPRRPTPEASTTPTPTNPAPPPRTISRDSSARLSAEQQTQVDAVLAAVDQSLTLPSSSLEDFAVTSKAIENISSRSNLRGAQSFEEWQAQEERERQEEVERLSKRAAAAYVPQYYSGTQAQIYFDDVLVDEIVQIQYATATNKMPIYGYASELFDTVASGNLLVQGSFVINFIEAGYLAIIAAAMLERKFGANAIGRRSERRWVDAKRRGALNSRLEVTTRPTSILTPGSYLSNQAINQVRGLGNKEFRELARELNINKLSKSNQYSGTPEGYASRFDLMAPFDIYLVLGDYTDPNADHTVRKLKNVHLTGQSQTIISSGEPVGEVYNFIARTIE